MNKEQIVKDFQNLTQLPESESRFYLESHNWNVELATSTFFGENKVSSKSVSKSQPVTQPKKQGGVKGLSDFRENEGDEDDKVRWYTGGEKSGIQVEAPKSNALNKDLYLNDLMDSAKKSGAQSIDEFNSQNSTFSGTGYRLGATNAKQTTFANKKQETQLKIIFWKSGFTVGDGPLRSYNDPANANFLDSVKKGELPRELSHLGNDVLVDLIDSRHEEYKEPPKVIQPFSGSGQKLGSGTQTSTISTQPTTNTLIQPLVVDESAPTTNLQVRCFDGSRLVGKFNHSHTIKDVRKFIDGNKKNNVGYDLYFSFPQKLISDENQTISSAGLLNSVIIQKSK